MCWAVNALSMATGEDDRCEGDCGTSRLLPLRGGVGEIEMLGTMEGEECVPGDGDGDGDGDMGGEREGDDTGT